jgi:hypothetical protein
MEAISIMSSNAEISYMGSPGYKHQLIELGLHGPMESKAPDFLQLK